MTADQMQGLFKIILAGWTSQRQRIAAGDIGEMAKIYAAGLMDLDFEAAKSAVIRIVHTAKFLPTVAEIREAAGIREYGPRRSGGEAWGSVIRAIRERGRHKTPGVDFAFNDPITARIVKAFGWFDLCASDNAVADRARFIDAYEAVERTERTEAQAAFGGRNPQLERGASPLEIAGGAEPLVLDRSPEERAELSRMAREIVSGLAKATRPPDHEDP